MTLQEFACRIDRVKLRQIKQQPGFIGRCPNCLLLGKDRSGTNFSCHESGTGYLKIYCQSGCEERDILSALGLKAEDLRIEQSAYLGDKTGQTRAKPTYIYDDVEDRYAFEKIRIDPKEPGGKKTFIQRVRFDEHGVEVPKVEYVSKSTGRRWMDYPSPDTFGLNGRADVLYRYRRVREAIERGETIYGGEGEKAADYWEDIGYPVLTCQRAGAGRGKWKSAYIEQLRGCKEFVWIADRDSAGEEFAKEVFTLTRAGGIRCRVVRSKTAGPGDDGYDHAKAGYKPEELEPAPDLMPARGLTVWVAPENFKPVKPEFVVEPYVPKAKMVLIDADGSTGKTCMCAAWAAALSNALHPVEFTPLPRRYRTLYLHHGEDSEDEIYTVYAANAGRRDCFGLAGRGLVFDEAGLSRLEETIIDGDYDMVVVDALFYFLLGVVRDTNDALSCIRIMEQLTALAERTGTTWLNLRHTVKGVVDKRASDLGMGTAQFRNSHRGQLILRKHPTEYGIICVTPGRASLLVEMGQPFFYRRVGNEIQYVRNIADPFGLDAGGKESDLTKLGKAKALLEDLLQGKVVLQTDVARAADKAGIGWKTIESASIEMRVSKSSRGYSDKKFRWSLPVQTEFGDYDAFADE